MEQNAAPPGSNQSIAGRSEGASPTGGTAREGPLAPGRPMPHVVSAALPGQSLLAWSEGRREHLLRALLEHGGVLFRGFRVGCVAEFERFITGLSDEVVDYTYRSTPRKEVEGRIYTSTEYPAEQSIPMHNEMSYTRSWPRKIWFYSVAVAAGGGETPIADSREVLRQVDPRIREKLVAKGVMYVRNYGTGLDLSWQDVFQTDDRAEVEAYCRRAGIELEWTGPDALRTRQVCQATAVHPDTGEEVWFNQAHLFHVSSLDPALREFFLAELGEEGLPRNAYYGDGSPLEEEYLEEIRAAYRHSEVVFPWQEEDVLMLDNMLVAHGRRPYTGSRRVVVGMADTWSAEAW